MDKNKVCWKITTKCNQGCKYCFGFTNIPDLAFSENEKILGNLLKSGVNHITWTGGEAVLYPKINELIKESKNKGIYNKLVTNGIYLSNNDNTYVEDILNSLDEINLSIDSIEEKINIALGKERNHLAIIKKLLEKLKDKDIKIRINTVVSRLNIEKLEELGDFLNNYKIEKWKFLKFMPIRERSLENKNQFEIAEEELENKIKGLKKFDNIKVVEYKKQSEFEKSIVVLPNADIIQTHNGKDYYLGNILKQDTFDFNNTHPKIKTLIAFNDTDTTNKIKKCFEQINYVDIVGVSDKGEDIYNKIVNLKPEMVFTQFRMNGFNVKSTKEKLNDDMPIFNLLMSSNIEESEVNEMYGILGDKLNSLISEPYSENIIDILEQYKEYKENKY